MHAQGDTAAIERVAPLRTIQYAEETREHNGLDILKDDVFARIADGTCDPKRTLAVFDLDETVTTVRPENVTPIRRSSEIISTLQEGIALADGRILSGVQTLGLTARTPIYMERPFAWADGLNGGAYSLEQLATAQYLNTVKDLGDGIRFIREGEKFGNSTLLSFTDFNDQPSSEGFFRLFNRPVGFDKVKQKIASQQLTLGNLLNLTGVLYYGSGFIMASEEGKGPVLHDFLRRMGLLSTSLLNSGRIFTLGFDPYSEEL